MGAPGRPRPQEAGSARRVRPGPADRGDRGGQERREGAEARGVLGPGRLGRIGARGRLGCDGAGRASGAETPAPPSAGPATPTPRAKMATWTAGEPGARGWEVGGGRTGGERRQKKPAPGNAAARLTFSSRSRRRRPPWRIGARGAFPRRRPPARSRPKRWLGPHAQRKGQVQRRGARRDAPSPGTARRELQAALAGLRLGLLGAPRARLSGPGQPLNTTVARTVLASPQTRRLCALRR